LCGAFKNMDPHPQLAEAPSVVSELDASRRPNFFIIGSMKSGTTYLRNLLASHPAIFMCYPKEPAYFVGPEELRTIWPWGWWEQRDFRRSEQNYLNLFRQAGAASIRGEASVYYTYLPLAAGVSKRLWRFNPGARLVYLMRDPIERTISHYWHRVRHAGEHRSISLAIKNDPQYCDVSYYAMQLAPYFRLFKRDQIRTLTFEELIGNTEASIVSLLKWLNLDHSTAMRTIPPENVTPDSITYRRAGWLLAGLRYKNRLLRAIIDHTPDPLRRAGVRMVTAEINRQSVDTSEIVEYLRPLQQSQTDELVKLLGREFPEWTTLNPR
jgi:Sulfotransferase family